MAKCIDRIDHKEFHSQKMDQYEFNDRFIIEIKKKSKIRSNPEISREWLDYKINELQTDESTLEKIVIEKILDKKINWIDFLEVLSILDLIELDDSTLISLMRDTRENAAQRVLDLIDTQYKWKESSKWCSAYCEIKYHNNWASI